MTLPEFFAALDFYNESQGGPSQGLEFTAKAADEMVTKVKKAIAAEDPEKRKKAIEAILSKKKPKSKVPHARLPR